MGTKRHLTTHIRSAILDTAEQGPVIDLFAGIGAVTTSLKNELPVIANDLLTFTNCLSRASFLNQPRRQPEDISNLLKPAFEYAYKAFSKKNPDGLSRETSILNSQNWTDIRDYIDTVPHVGNSNDTLTQAGIASKSRGVNHYQLTQLYFAGSYLSLQQAMQVDAIRYAIARAYGDHDIAIAAWLGAVNDCVNSPGHTAQFLQGQTEESAVRVRRYWRRNVWTCFENRLTQFRQVGSRMWRSKNSVTNYEAREALTELPRFKAVYADPPYTKDHYSRYYHLYETLYQYDYPACQGKGRYRENRFVSDFSRKSTVTEAFHQMLSGISDKEANLVLSYPSNGLLHQSGTSLDGMLNQIGRASCWETV